TNWRFAELAECDVNGLLGLLTECGELSANDGNETGYAIAGFVIENFVAAGKIVGVHTPLEQRVADTRPGSHGPPAACLRQRTGGSFDHVRNFISMDVEICVHGIPVVVGVRRADDGLGAVRNEEHHAAIDAFKNQTVVADAPLEGDVYTFARTHRDPGVGHLRNRAGPRPRRVDDEARFDRSLL